MTDYDYKLSPPDPPEGFRCCLCDGDFDTNFFGGKDDDDCDLCDGCMELHTRSLAEQAMEDQP